MDTEHRNDAARREAWALIAEATDDAVTVPGLDADSLAALTRLRAAAFEIAERRPLRVA